MIFIEDLTKSLKQNANRENAFYMENYMKNNFTFLGIKTEERRSVFKANCEKHKTEIKENFRKIAWELFNKKEREFHQCAIDLLVKEFKKNYILDDIQLIEKLLVTNSWWDSVDVVAKYLLGGYLQQFSNETYKVIERFSNSNNLWLNRSAIIFQLSYKEKTNFDLLKSECEKHKESKEFFIQKAIGWALRDYSRFNQNGVTEYVNSTNLKPLSKKKRCEILNKPYICGTFKQNAKPNFSKNTALFRNIFKTFEVVFFTAKTILPERSFIYLSCIAVAISCSFAVIVLKSFAHKVFVLATYINGYLKLPYVNSIFPIIGILLTVFVVRRFLDGSIDIGSSKILQAVAKKGGIVPRKQMYAQIITSSLTVGLGGSAGLESPIVITGAAFGSNFAQKYKLPKKDRILLLACGVAAGISAAFNAPIAGVLFAIEVVLADITISAFIPIMISAATGALVSTIILSQDILLNFKQDEVFDFHNTPYYILLGIFAGLVSVYHARTFRKVEHYFAKLKTGVYRKALFGATILALLIFLFPTLFGEGYESIKILSSSKPDEILNNTVLDTYKSNEWILLVFVGVTALLKSLATGLTLGSGGNGGNFAPSLFVGSYLGFFVAKFFHLTGINHELPVVNFTIVGMAGILSGLFHAPLTAIFLIGEITGGYDLMVPLMIVSSVSYAVSKRFETHSMDVKTLADKGQVFTSDKDKNILQSIDILKHIQTEVKTVKQNDLLENILETLTNTDQKIFPVVDDKNKLISVVNYNSIQKHIFNSFRLKYTTIKEIMPENYNSVKLDDGLEVIMEQFEKSNTTCLPITKSDKFYGTISKLDLLESYREKLKEMVIE